MTGNLGTHLCGNCAVDVGEGESHTLECAHSLGMLSGATAACASHWTIAREEWTYVVTAGEDARNDEDIVSEAFTTLVLETVLDMKVSGTLLDGVLNVNEITLVMGTGGPHTQFTLYASTPDQARWEQWTWFGEEASEFLHTHDGYMALFDLLNDHATGAVVNREYV